MSAFSSCAFEGTVVHKRLVPRRHAFSYRVFALCLDVDEIDALDQRLRLFGRNRTRLVSFHDRDVGERTAEPVAAKARRLLAAHGLGAFGARITLLTYPRLVGYVFNPLSVYFCHDEAGRLGSLLYEVTNTFGERKCYAVPVGAGAGAMGSVVAQSCAKELYVSPFTARAGTYGFHIEPPHERVAIGVSLREAQGPVLKTHFTGRRVPLDDASIARLVLRHPLMTLKVMGAIHVEAARLWLKRVPLVDRHVSPNYSVTLASPTTREALDV
jgi:DUF1365 family protein